MDITFQIPAGMAPKELAQTFTALIRQIRGESFEGNRDGAHGPFQMRAGSDDHWQLDGTNDYWLHIHEDGTALLRCRYSREEAIIRGAMRLFEDHHLALAIRDTPPDGGF